MSDDVRRFIVVDTLYERYTIVIDLLDQQTSVYCNECEQWVAHYEGEQLTQHTRNELYEQIIEAHTEQVLGDMVEFDDNRNL